MRIDSRNFPFEMKLIITPIKRFHANDKFEKRFYEYLYCTWKSV